MPKIVRFYQTGPAEVLQIEDLPQQEPKENEVRLKIQAIGLNRAEIMFRTGAYLESPVFPARLGLEAAGIVDAVSAGVTGIKIGERVSTVPSFSMSSNGIYGEEAIVPAHAVARYPSELSPVEGAAIWMQYLTVWGALVHHGKVGPGLSVLIAAASSSVGLAAIEVSNLLGAKTIAVTRTSAKKRALLDVGAAQVIASAEEDLPAMVREYTDGEGVDLIFDPVAGRFLETLAACAGQNASIIEYAGSAARPRRFRFFLPSRKA